MSREAGVSPSAQHPATPDPNHSHWREKLAQVMMRRRTGGFPLLARTQQGRFTACDAVLKRKPTQFCQGSICRPQQGALEVNHCPQPMGFDW